MTPKRNPVGWFEIYVADMNRAKAFYEGVLQIKLETLPTPAMDEPMEMWMFPGAMDGDTPGCSGALCKMEGCAPGGGGTLIYFSCEDCAAEAGRVTAHGGMVYKEKFPIGEYGHIAIVADTEGNTIGLHSIN